MVRTEGQGVGWSCADAEAGLTALIDGELGPEDAAALEAHLAGCAACREAQRELAAVRDLAGRWVLAETPDLWPALASQIAPEPLDMILAELRALRAEVAALRRELAARPAPAPTGSTPLDVPYMPRTTRSRFPFV